MARTFEVKTVDNRTVFVKAEKIVIANDVAQLANDTQTGYVFVFTIPLAQLVYIVDTAAIQPQPE